MTTIVYQRGVLATDKQGSDNGVKCKAGSKLQIYNGIVYAVAGGLLYGLKFIDWLRSSRDYDAPKLKGTQVVEMDMITGKAQLWEGDFPVPVEDAFYAWGSGSHLALGALEMGASPAEAVRCAAKWDEGTGKGVHLVIAKKAEIVDNE